MCVSRNKTKIEQQSIHSPEETAVMPQHPRVEDLINEAQVCLALNTAWENSFRGAFLSAEKTQRSNSYQRVSEQRDTVEDISAQEAGGWIFQQQSNPGNFFCQPMAGANANEIDLRNPILPEGDWYLVATYHTHPNPPIDIGQLVAGDPRPSGADLDNSAFNRVPGIVLTWPLDEFHRHLGYAPQANVTRVETDVDETRPHTYLGTVFGYGPVRRVGWFEGPRGFPKVPAAVGYEPLEEVVLGSFDYMLPKRISERLQLYCSLARA